ncbi:hypothetical protein [uncultured Rhodoferax sp.]|uniref:hypothetical protein n=1 Tax=uncultured Rhodoferax sp. TaxID=223188 RepID=UPI0025CD5293|nr:hypothetical protein [uncultured Rhodoferax sp.]
MSALPDGWVEKIWTAMRAAYGAAFDRQWEVPAGVDPVAHVAEMKQMWGRQLSHYQQSPNAIAFALDNLPARVTPPTLPEFRALCRQYVRPGEKKQLAAPGHRQIPMELKSAFKRLAVPVDSTVPHKVQVARRFIELHGNQQHLGPLQRENLQRYRDVVARYEAQQAAAAAREAEEQGT